MELFYSIDSWFGGVSVVVAVLIVVVPVVLVVFVVDVVVFGGY